MKYVFGKTKFKLILAAITFFGLFVYYLNYDDGIYYVYKDNQYPFKTFPDSEVTTDSNDLNVHTKIVYPNNEVNTEYEIVDQSFLDGTELDRAEQSLSFEYDENIIEYSGSDNFIMEALELLDPQSPTSQTYGIYEKQPIPKEFVLLDNNFIIMDDDLRQNFYIQTSTADHLIRLTSIDDVNDETIKTNNKIDISYSDPIDLESILRNSEAFTNNVVDNEIFTAMISEEESPIDVMLQNPEIDIDVNYPLDKPDDLITPQIKSIIMDDFDTKIISEPVEFKKIYYGVQVSSVSSRLDANKFYEGLLINYSTLLSRENDSHKNLIKQEDLGSLGTWYKLRIGPFEDRSEAKRLCSSMRDEGLEGCIVVELE